MTRPTRVLVVLLVALAGCGKPVPPPDSPVPQAAAVGPPVTTDEAKAFGAKFEAAMAEGDETALTALFPIVEMLKQAVADTNVPPLSTADRARAIKQFSGQFLGLVKNGGSYRLLRVRDVNGKPQVLFRLVQQDGALNYHDLSLARTAGGQVVAEDALVMVTGEPLRQTMRRFMIQLLSEQQRKRLTGKDQLYTQHLDEILAFMKNVREDKHADALAAYRKWPAELRKDKTLGIMAVLAASKLGDDAAYLRELEAYRTNFPNDPGGDLVSIDYYLLKKQYDETLAVLDRLQKAVGGDPYLDALRANVFAEMGKFPEARKLAEKVVADDPTLTAAYWARVSVALTEKNHADTLTWLKKVVEERGEGLDLENIAEDKAYAHFAKSPEFQTLKKWWAAREK